MKLTLARQPARARGRRRGAGRAHAGLARTAFEQLGWTMHERGDDPAALACWQDALAILSEDADFRASEAARLKELAATPAAQPRSPASSSH